MTTAFVLSGGASLGSIQVGMLLALAEAGIAPDLIVGTSVGALNGGWISSRPDIDGINGLADLWRSLSRKDVFPTNLSVDSWASSANARVWYPIPDFDGSSRNTCCFAVLKMHLYRCTS